MESKGLQHDKAHLMNEAILLSHHWKGHHFLEESHLEEMLTQLGNDVNEKQCYCDWPLGFGSYVLEASGKHIVTEFARKTGEISSMPNQRSIQSKLWFQ